jgi:VanZ family protein
MILNENSSCVLTSIDGWGRHARGLDLATFACKGRPKAGPMWKVQLVKVFHVLSLWLFWPGVILIIWGELIPHPPDLSSVLGWDKAQHFTAYFGLASMATMVLGLRPRLAPAILGIILLGGALEIAQAYTGRDADLLDFLANTIGALAGVLVAASFLLLLRGRALVGRPVTD